MKGKRSTDWLRVATIAGAAAGTLFAAGCGAPPPEEGAPPNALTSAQMAKYEKDSQVSPAADAGVTVQANPGIDAEKFHNLVTSRSFSSRSDPFALLAMEKKFDVSQNAERLLGLGGGYSLDWKPAPEPEPEPIEPQPYRRLAGVMVGDSIAAIIDMGDGKGTQIIYPGETIPGTEWTVVSIDSEKAVLRRPGKKKPKEVIVPLAASMGGIVLPGGGGGTTPGGTGRPGGPGGMSGAPGAPGMGPAGGS